ncbi:SURF1 family protein [Streptomyces sp. LX-29]|uniref:SURF1 family cytochrome oxidase biogenesis protein n=1 Tax=Streptomyces sp. LX-29 TaxID=2900152 RepID=UPI00240D8888|nr:SURF1 family protein [Streptomyces sp. LX-29]WFB10203.1 SURF1 family protein [Streptomyces sp. LX-29]
MYRFLLSRQWVILTLVGLVLIPSMIELGFWQFHRHQNRVAHNDLIAESLKSPAVPVGELTTPGRPVDRAVTWRTVTATGTYDTRHEVVVRQRTGANEAVGYFVVTPLLLKGGGKDGVKGDGAVVMVNRGWIPPGGDLTKFPEVPAPPRGEVTVTGRLRADETTGNSGIKDKSGLPERQVMLINSERLAEPLDRPALGGYLELIKSSPAGREQPTPVEEPDHSSIGSHMAYAIQWWLFTAGVPIGWVVLFRRELRDRAEAAAKEAKAKAKAADKAPAKEATDTDTTVAPDAVATDATATATPVAATAGTGTANGDESREVAQTAGSAD